MWSSGVKGFKPKFRLFWSPTEWNVLCFSCLWMKWIQFELSDCIALLDEPLEPKNEMLFYFALTRTAQWRNKRLQTPEPDKDPLRLRSLSKICMLSCKFKINIIKHFAVFSPLTPIFVYYLAPFLLYHKIIFLHLSLSFKIIHICKTTRKNDWILFLYHRYFPVFLSELLSWADKGRLM